MDILCGFFYPFFRKLIVTLTIVGYLCNGRWWFQNIGSDDTAYMYYMDIDVRHPREAVKINHSLTNFIAKSCYVKKYDSFARFKRNRNTYSMLDTVIKSCYTNVKIGVKYPRIFQ